jgi:hypothetical protein
MSQPHEPLRQSLDSSDPVEARAAALVSSVQPLPVSRARMRRVRRRLDERRRGVGAILLRPAVVVGMLLGLTAVAAATWGTLRAARSSAPEPASEPPAPPAVMPTGAPRRATPTLVSTPPASAEPEAADQPEEPEKDAPRPRAAQPSSEAALVQGAVTALRRDRDPEKASRLLREYQQRNPGGALSEEALALAVEAAMARKDPKAASLARRYLAKYPNGRFRQVAQRALRSAEPR